MHRVVALATVLVIIALGGPASVQSSQESGAKLSGVIEDLHRSITNGRSGAVDSFWTMVQARGTPIVENGSVDGNVNVTFLWRATGEHRILLLTDFLFNLHEMAFQRLPATDVWFLTLQLPADARFLYRISVDDPAYPFFHTNPPTYPRNAVEDPRNTRRWPADSAARTFSVAELPHAPPLSKSPPARRGTLTAFDDSFQSSALKNAREVLVYTPPAYNAKEAHAVLVVPASYIKQIPLPDIVDDLSARDSLPPLIIVFVGPSDNQDVEMGCNRAYSDMLARELMPRIRARYRLRNDPRWTAVGGASAGGLAAACAGLHHPETFGVVISQSGAFWRGTGGTAAYWGSAERQEGREGFAHLIATLPRAQVRFHLSIGRLERATPFAPGVISMIDANRHVRDVLLAKGYTVSLTEINGGHDPFNWQATLPPLIKGAFARK